MKTFKIMRIDYGQVLTVQTSNGVAIHPKNPVAEGVVFKSGKVVLNWLGEIASVVVHDNIENVIKIHCNGDASLIGYIEENKNVGRNETLITVGSTQIKCGQSNK